MHNPSKLQPSQIKHGYSKPSTQSDANATISSETHNLGQLDLFNLQSKQTPTISNATCVFQAKFNFPECNALSLSQLQVFQLKRA